MCIAGYLFQRGLSANIGAVSFLMAAVMMRRGELLKVGLADRIHVPYRLPLISGAEEAMKNADKKDVTV